MGKKSVAGCTEEGGWGRGHNIVHNRPLVDNPEGNSGVISKLLQRGFRRNGLRGYKRRDAGNGKKSGQKMRGEFARTRKVTPSRPGDNQGKNVGFRPAGGNNRPAST